MASLLETLAALATAGTMMISSSLDAAAPQNDVDGFLFLQNRQWLASCAYEPETVTADVPGQIRQMRQEAALALEEMFDACKKDIGITLKAVSGYRSYARQETIYNNKLERVHGSVEKADEYVATEDTLTDIFGSKEMRSPAPTEFIPKNKTAPEIAYQLVKDETYPQTQPRLNLATFVTTYMDDYATRLMNEAININYIDETEYPRVAVMCGM